MDELMLFGINPSDIHKCWLKIEKPIQNALKYSDGKYNIADIECSLKTHEMQLWVIVDKIGSMKAVIITQIVSYPQKKVMFFVLIHGIKFGDWKHFIDDFVSFAKSHDCTAIEGYGRPGWEKKISDIGFSKVHTVYRLQIGDRQK